MVKAGRTEGPILELMVSKPSKAFQMTSRGQARANAGHPLGLTGREEELCDCRESCLLLLLNK